MWVQKMGKVETMVLIPTFEQNQAHLQQKNQRLNTNQTPNASMLDPAAAIFMVLGVPRQETSTGLIEGMIHEDRTSQILQH